MNSETVSPFYESRCKTHVDSYKQGSMVDNEGCVDLRRRVGIKSKSSDLIAIVQILNS
jgi:hypothetical protein